MMTGNDRKAFLPTRRARKEPHIGGSCQAMSCYPEGATGVQGTVHADTVG
jgi:hypothetical protein